MPKGVFGLAEVQKSKIVNHLSNKSDRVPNLVCENGIVPRTLFLIFISFFSVFYTYLLSKNLNFHSIKISYYYLLAKFYTVVGIENFNINISGSFGVVFTRKAIDVVNNLYAIEIFNNTSNILLSSIITSLLWTGYLLVFLVLLFGIKVCLDNGKKRTFIFWRIVNGFSIQIRRNSTIQKQIAFDYQVDKKEQNVDAQKNFSSKSKNYLLISDKNLPYPIIKKVVLVEQKQ
jgi:hypothetical protein